MIPGRTLKDCVQNRSSIQRLLRVVESSTVCVPATSRSGCPVQEALYEAIPGLHQAVRLLEDERQSLLPGSPAANPQ